MAPAGGVKRLIATNGWETRFPCLTQDSGWLLPPPPLQCAGLSCTCWGAMGPVEAAGAQR